MCVTLLHMIMRDFMAKKTTKTMNPGLCFTKMYKFQCGLGLPHGYCLHFTEILTRERNA
jgi:hypothetical protein